MGSESRGESDTRCVMPVKLRALRASFRTSLFFSGRCCPAQAFFALVGAFSFFLSVFPLLSFSFFITFVARDCSTYQIRPVVDSRHPHGEQ